jgi:hypothetical protein
LRAACSSRPMPPTPPPSRVRSDVHVRHRGAEYVNKSGIKWMSSSTK